MTNHRRLTTQYNKGSKCHRYKPKLCHVLFLKRNDGILGMRQYEFVLTDCLATELIKLMFLNQSAIALLMYANTCI